MSADISIGAEGEAFIIAEEVTDEAVYRHTLSAPTWPGGASGVTIGIGYDVGTVTEAQFRADWEALLPPAWTTRLAKCCGVQGDKAKPLAAALRDISIDYSAAILVFRGRSIPQVAAQLCRAIPGAALLPRPARASLVSLVYNRGCSFHVQDDRHREMRAIAAAINDGHLDAVPGQIRAMKRLWVVNPDALEKDWQPLPGMAGLLGRRDREAAMFSAAIASQEAAPEPTPAPATPAAPVPVHVVGDPAPAEHAGAG